MQLRLIFALAFMLMGGGISYAGGGSSKKNYYSKVTVTAIGNGKVYVKYNSDTTPGDADYGTENSAQKDEDSQSSAPTHKYYLWAKPNFGYQFLRWSSNEVIGSGNPYSASVTAAEDVSNATKSYSASFTPFEEFTNASINAPYNGTSFIVNPGFETSNSNGWTSSGSVVMEIKNTAPANVPKDGTYFAEKWGASGSIDWNQTLTDMPAGRYMISVIARNEADAPAYLYANEDKILINKNQTTRYVVSTVLNEQGNIKFGVKCDNHPANTWFAIDDFQIHYLGDCSEMNSATEDTPIDVTGLIVNPNASDNAGWNFVQAAYNNGAAERIDGQMLEISDWGANSFNASAKQTLSNLPAGHYVLKAVVQASAGALVSLQLGNDQTEWTNGHGTTAGTTGTYGWDYIQVESDIHTGTAEIGALAQTSSSHNWSNWDNFQLLYYGRPAGKVVTEDETLWVIGDHATEPEINVTAAITRVDLTGATGINDLSINTTANPNVLIYANAGQVSNANNVVINGTCANLVLTDGYTFQAHKNFEATSASYNMTAIAENAEGKSFGTLMLPFAVSSLPGKAYTLDQGVAFGDEIQATEVNAIQANTPVLVTAAGAYTASQASIAATNTSYTNGELIGTYKAQTAVAGTYVMQKHGNRVAFYIVGDTKPTVNPFRAYIKAQNAGTRERISIKFDDATGIGDVEAVPEIADGKYIENGVITIVKAGKRYGVTGLRK